MKDKNHEYADEKLKEITEEDLFTDDNVLLHKLKNTKNVEAHKLLERLQPGKEFEYAKKADAEFYGPNKPRYVAPWVKTTDGLNQISEMVPSLSYLFR